MSRALLIQACLTCLFSSHCLYVLVAAGGKKPTENNNTKDVFRQLSEGQTKKKKNRRRSEGHEEKTTKKRGNKNPSAFRRPETQKKNLFHSHCLYVLVGASVALLFARAFSIPFFAPPFSAHPIFWAGS